MAKRHPTEEPQAGEGRGPFVSSGHAAEPVGGQGVAREPEAFRGYNPVRYTPCPDEFFDQQMAEMDDDELRVTLYAFRRTFGFKKTSDTISISQFLHGITTRDGRQLDRGCGLKTPRQVLAGLAKAERRRTLLSAFFCRGCGGRVPEETMIAEERSQRMVNGEQRRYSVQVVPRLCPHCGARLRGFEEKCYLLNVLDEASNNQAGASPRSPRVAPVATSPSSVNQTDPPPSVKQTVPPAVILTDPLYPFQQKGSTAPTETRNRTQETGLQEIQSRLTRQNDTAPVFVPPGSQLPSHQLWAMVIAQAGPHLDRADREGWLRATALLAAQQPANGIDEPLTIILGVPTEHARRRCAGHVSQSLTAALMLLLNRRVRIEAVISADWLATRS